MDSTNKNRRTGANGNQKLSFGQMQFGRILFAPTVILFFALVFGGCEKDDLGNVKPDSFNGKVTAKVENGAAYNSQISTVWALYDAKINSSGGLTGQMLANGGYVDGGFTIDLPAIPSSYLMNIQTFFGSIVNGSEGLEFSDPDVRLLDADFFGISSDNKYVDYFIYTTGGTKRTTCLFVYSNGEATVKGGKNINVALSQGWNRIYFSTSENKLTSKAPKGMKWFINNDVK